MMTRPDQTRTRKEKGEEKDPIQRCTRELWDWETKRERKHHRQWWWRW